MFVLIVLSVCLMILSHKAKYGTYIGDVPESIYCILIIIPMIVVAFGILVIYFDNKR